jgi:hypothetical protein
MKIRAFIFLLHVAVCVYAVEDTECSELQKMTNLCTSIVTLPFSGPYLAFADGATFNYHPIARDVIGEGSIKPNSFITRSEGNGTLCELNDGMEVPLVLGSMPRDKECIEELKKVFGLGPCDRIAVHSMNLPFEIAWGGLGSVVKKDPYVSLFSYPTVDECAPSLVDTLRVIKRLMRRDEQAYELHYLHCLAGRGRSATIAAIYILCYLHKKDRLIDAENALQYLKRCRSHIKLSEVQKRYVENFQRLLASTENGFVGLCAKYAQAIEQREKECAYSAITGTIRDQEAVYMSIKCCMALLICFLFGMVV